MIKKSGEHPVSIWWSMHVSFAPTGNVPTSCGSTEFRPRIGEARECGRVSQLSQHSEEITKRL